MTPKSNYLIGGLAVTAAMICALPLAQGIGAATSSDAFAAEAAVATTVPARLQTIPHVNRAAKGDRIVVPVSISVKKNVPDQSSRHTPLADPDPIERAPLLDGCEPAFSPVTVPSMAHLASRCIG
jgi:hypothetical protein